ncbi:MAG TPA: translation elongation factor Ts [Candidatus Pacearchaeota archaeon]|nr:translation elongation factor Ts [Candidatus Pacearchaeota archaeon]HOS12582.1 translation elongation factor Ts [Candidatus Pacearchaeota archaeon]HPL72722.1 translation elongation factor Ts [Candidatus Pacearchaeota archaeon]HQB18624.1 translation elongation factor Ts [Candidatus Pacearchaeota archaeon]
MVEIETIKKLREETGISLGDCKKALEESNGDISLAKEYLKKRGAAVALKKTEREASAGIIDSYIHSNKRLGVLLEINCETDFVARGEEFQNLAHEVCLQIASMKPMYLKEEEIPQSVLEKEKEIITEQVKEMNKPAEVLEGIIKGKLEKYKKEVCLLDQLWIKDDSKTIQSLINEYIAKIGENIIVKRFVIYEL